MRRRQIAELAALGAAAAVWSYVGWDSALWDPRYQLALHLAAIAAIAGLAVLALRGTALPRSRIDLPVLALLTAFGVASLSAWNPGLSASALAGIVATTAMFPVALLALRHRPGWTGLIVSLPIIGLSAGALVVLVWRRVEWVLAGGVGLPPLRLGHEGTPFGSVAVPPFVILAALPIALGVPDRRLRRGLVAGLAVVGVPLAVISGSRSAWLAMGVAAFVLAIPYIGRIRTTLTWGRALMGAGAGVLVIGATVVLIGGRVVQASSLLYRAYLWRDTLSAWRMDPLLGIGPGSMPYAREAAAPALSFPVAQPHSHDIPLGILGDAGIVGLAVALALAVWFVAVAGPWRLRTHTGRAAFAVLAGFSVGMLFEDLTFLPNFNLLVLLLVAICLTDAGAVTWRAVRPPRFFRVAVGAAGLALIVVMVLGDGASVAYRNGVDAAANGNWLAANASLVTAVRLNPWQPTGPKILALTADRTGHLALAQASAARATKLNPGDSASWTNLALLCLESGDTDCARRAADHSVASTPAGGFELVNAAVVYDRLGLLSKADAAYRLSLLTNWWTGLSVPWPRTIPIETDRIAELDDEVTELNALVARRVQGEDLAIESYRYPVPRALALAMHGDRDAARAALVQATHSEPSSPLTWQIVALLQRHWGEDDAHALHMIEVTTGAGVSFAAPRGAARLTQDIATFRAYPDDGLIAGAHRLTPTGAWPWVLEPLLAP
jgi:O-antigen ligase